MLRRAIQTLVLHKSEKKLQSLKLFGTSTRFSTKQSLLLFNEIYIEIDITNFRAKFFFKILLNF